jgi:hypothetical protein
LRLLVAGDDIGVFGKHVDDLAFASSPHGRRDNLDGHSVYRGWENADRPAQKNLAPHGAEIIGGSRLR